MEVKKYNPFVVIKSKPKVKLSQSLKLNLKLRD